VAKNISKSKSSATATVLDQEKARFVSKNTNDNEFKQSLKEPSKKPEKPLAGRCKKRKEKIKR